MASSILPVFGKVIGVPAPTARASRSYKNGIWISITSRGAVDMALLKTDSPKFNVKCKATGQNGQTQRNSTVFKHSSTTDIVQLPKSAVGIVREFYSGINRHELGSVEDLIAENCVYEDLVFPEPFVGKKVFC
eukprot:Gb_31951 [translate_table: standard]